MKRAAFFLMLFCPAISQAQSPILRDSSVISVQELAMPRKAAHAFQKGTALLIKGKAQASIPYFQTTIKLAPNFYKSYHNLALAQFRLGHLDDAAQNFQKSIDLSKGAFAPSLFAFSMILYRHSDYTHAESLIQQGLLETPGSAVGKYCLGLVQFSLGHFPAAQRSALDALRLDPAEIDAHLLLAHIHERLHEPYAVMDDVRIYLQLSPNGDLKDDALTLLQRAQQDVARLSASLTRP